MTATLESPHQPAASFPLPPSSFSSSLSLRAEGRLHPPAESRLQPAIIGGFPMLLAEADQWREMGRDFRVDHAKLPPGLIIASVVVLVIVVAFLWFLHRLMNRQEGRRVYNSPKQLFRSLCRVHELTAAQRRALVQLARAQQLRQPASLFLEPDQFDAAMKSKALPSQRKELETLRAVLFADLEAPALLNPEP